MFLWAHKHTHAGPEHVFQEAVYLLSVEVTQNTLLSKMSEFTDAPAFCNSKITKSISSKSVYIYSYQYRWRYVARAHARRHTLTH